MRIRAKTRHLQLLHELLEVALGAVLTHDVEHDLTDLTDLAGLGVTGRLLSLVGLLLGESNAEHTEQVTVGGSHVDVALNKRLPLADEGAQLVSGHIHTGKVGVKVVTLNVLSDQSDLAVLLGLVTAVKVGEGELEDTALKTVRGDLGTLGAGHQGLATVPVGEHGRRLDDVLVLQGEGVDSLLLASLLPLAKSLVLSDSHLLQTIQVRMIGSNRKGKGKRRWVSVAREEKKLATKRHFR